METDPVFTHVLERRERILGRLISTRTQFDAWIEEHRVHQPTVTDLAQFEGLLAERRNMLDELLKLDDSLLDHLVNLLGRGSSKTEA